MKNFLLVAGVLASLSFHSGLSAHCQMPCGIYHDDMVFDQIDQYVETMYKGMTMLRDSKFATPKDRCEFARWVMTKDNSSDELADLITTYFLQQKIKPDEQDTAKKLTSAHKMLFLLVQIKQNVDRNLVESFADEWENFKLMFHVEGYACKVEELRQKQRQQKLAELKKHELPHDHDHDHDDHDHAH